MEMKGLGGLHYLPKVGTTIRVAPLAIDLNLQLACMHTELMAFEPDQTDMASFSETKMPRKPAW